MANKWRKWQIGAAGAVAAAFLFHNVKASPQFQQAVLTAQADSLTPAAEQTAQSDKVMEEWQNERRQLAGGQNDRGRGNGLDRGGQKRQPSSGVSGSDQNRMNGSQSQTSPDSSSGTRAPTRTTRS